MKKAFLHNEIWTLTFGASFQRAYVYLDNIRNEQKETFKSKTREYVERILVPQYALVVNDSRHVKNICLLSDYTREFNHLLKGGRLNFGISQKLLNLHLKYLWCLELIPTPPHFPVDRRIQEIIGFNPIVNWTRFSDEKDYLRIINHVRSQLQPNQSIAEFELEKFERRVKTK